MSNGHGGARIGAGRKRKPLAEKILDGNTGSRKPKKLLDVKEIEIPELNAEDIPQPSDWLKADTKNTLQNVGPKIFESTWLWLKARRCEHLITKEQIEQYASDIARWVQCEEGINQFGLLAKHATTGMPVTSPFVSMRERFRKQINVSWMQIYQVVKENSEVDVDGNPSDDIMEKILSGRI